MHVFEIVIALLVGGAVLAAFARRIGTPYPALVALGGAAVAIVPGTPELVLDPEDDGTVDREVQLARVETLRAALQAAEGPWTETTGLVKRRYELQLKRAEAELEAGQSDSPPRARAAADDHAGPPADVEIIHKAPEAERQRLGALRAEGTIGDAAFQRVEQELDWTELDLQQTLGATDE